MDVFFKKIKNKKMTPPDIPVIQNIVPVITPPIFNGF